MATEDMKVPGVRPNTQDDVRRWTGRAVTYTDPVGVEHDALITAVWGMNDDDVPSVVNLVHVSAEESQRDNYGRQIERPTSVQRKGPHTAHGRYFEVR